MTAPSSCTVEFPSWTADYPANVERDDHLIIAGRNVGLRSNPDAGAPIIARLSYEVVERASDVNQFGQRWANQWVRVQTAAGLRGYVPVGAAYEADTGPRMVFALRNGLWRLVLFGTGD